MTAISAHLVDNKEEGWGRLCSAMGRYRPLALAFRLLLVQNKRMKEILPNKYKNRTNKC